ncbi:MAG: catalase [Lachnospiraceae bacterium]|nr:catalase [Lachnospiraceae bacterium]
MNRNWWYHLKTINHHKMLVMKHCFKIGLYKQGLLHDLSKYTPAEFLTGVKYYQDGKRSPNNAEREATGCSTAWLHHKGRNKHHLEYWIDYGLSKDDTMVGCRMPIKYVLEMFCDRVAASKNYNKGTYTDADPYLYYAKSREHYLIHEETRELLERLLIMLKDRGEEETFRYIRMEILNKKK